MKQKTLRVYFDDCSIPKFTLVTPDFVARWFQPRVSEPAKLNSADWNFIEGVMIIQRALEKSANWHFNPQK